MINENYSIDNILRLKKTLRRLIDDEEYESTEEEREFREKRQKKFQQEQRFAICAGLYLSHLPNDLARLIAAYAIPNSKIYDYMHTS